MAGVTGKAGRRPHHEDGPGSSSPEHRIPATAGPLAGALSPLAAVALRYWNRADLEGGFGLALLDGEGREALLLGPFCEEEIVATWRSIGLEAGLELMIETPDGVLKAPYPQIGRVSLGPITIRRRHGLLSGRRPRFLVRRKTGRIAPRPLIHREREIAGGGGA
jgi:hypothetical protein